MKKISIIIPLFNEEDNIPKLHERITAVFAKMKDYDHEIIFVDDGSSDGSVAIIEGLAKEDPNVKYVEFSRNFGKELATTAGLHNATGDAAIILDADLQHPPELIPKFVWTWEKGAEVVIGVRKNNVAQSKIKHLGSEAFNWFSALISETDFIPYATDFRLMDKAVVDEFKKFPERTRITRGLIDWLGFKRVLIDFEAAPRNAGTASYSKLKLTKLALTGFISHSFFPLRIAGYLGIIMIIISAPVEVFVIITKFFLGNPFSFTGTAALAVAILFLIGIVLACLGLIALYIENIHVEVTKRPLYVIRKNKV